MSSYELSVFVHKKWDVDRYVQNTKLQYNLMRVGERKSFKVIIHKNWTVDYAVCLRIDAAKVYKFYLV